MCTSNTLNNLVCTHIQHDITLRDQVTEKPLALRGQNTYSMYSARTRNVSSRKMCNAPLYRARVPGTVSTNLFLHLSLLHLSRSFGPLIRVLREKLDGWQVSCESLKISNYSPLIGHKACVFTSSKRFKIHSNLGLRLFYSSCSVVPAVLFTETNFPAHLW